MKLFERLKAIREASDRFKALQQSGASAEEAGEAVLAEMQEKYSAVDWATLLPLILQLVTMLVELFKKPS